MRDLRRAVVVAALLATAACGDSGARSTATASGPTTTSTSVEPQPGTSVAAEVPPAPSQSVPGLLTFRGNRTRTFYGQGPVPANPAVVRRFPDEPMCAESFDTGGLSRWCGMGWTGQPAIVEREGRTWVVFGAYDRAVHFLDAETGRRILPDFPTGDIVKGSVTIDPDGYPLVYTGSRDNYLRVLAIDRPAPVELWRLSAYDVSPILWNDDWDGSPLIVDDYLIEGGENSQLHVVKLNRGYGPDGMVTVAPQLVFSTPAWDPELLRDLGDSQVSIEGSVAIWQDTVYFANSGGLVQGWDISGLAEGHEPERTFRFWTGDDTDATVVIDDHGMLYVASEWERHNPRSREVGQIIKLDPRRPDPLLWRIADQEADPADPLGVAGVWGTPALYKDLVVVPTHGGRLLGIDRDSGRVRWTKRLPGPLWQSPVVVEGVLLQGDCRGVLHAYDLSDTAVDPPDLWSLAVGGCIEATPAVWKGRIFLGTRAGFLNTIG